MFNKESTTEEVNEDLPDLKEEFSTEKGVIKEEPSYDQADTDADTMSTVTDADTRDMVIIIFNFESSVQYFEFFLSPFFYAR